MNAIRTTTAALALLAAGGFAYAQDTKLPEQVPAELKADCPAAGTVPEDQLPANCKTGAAAEQQPGMTDTTKTDTTQTDNTKTDATKTDEPAAAAVDPAKPVAPVDAAVTNLDTSKAFLASNFIGQTVYSQASENVGEINDLVVSKDQGGAVVAIVGVGGFLGMGEKDVAIDMNRITVAKQENEALRLMIDMTREQLEAAPAFDRKLLRVSSGG
jgi:sporulation protein YlmC with PRC-barrel domain